MRVLRRLQRRIAELIDPGVKKLRLTDERLSVDMDTDGMVSFEDSAYLVLNRRVEWDSAEETWYLLTGYDFEPGDRVVLMHGRNDIFADEGVITRKIGTLNFAHGTINRWGVEFPN